MKSAGVLLDTGPLVALLSRRDSEHERAKALFAECEPPLRTCEAVVVEACHLLRKADTRAPAEVVGLGRKGMYEIALSLSLEFGAVETLFEKYQRRGISLADACLIRCAELYGEPRIMTFDSDFAFYRWGRNRTFQTL
jgi:predicted nucleic acid-binding protein